MIPAHVGVDLVEKFRSDEVEQVGREIRETVLQWTGIPTSIGIAKNKTLSKVANHIAKKKQSGVTSLIGIENLDPILEKIEINDVWGVGRQLTKFYQKNGIYNAKQLKNKSNTWIKKNSNVPAEFVKMGILSKYCHHRIPYRKKTYEVGFQGLVHTYRQNFFSKLQKNGINLEILPREPFYKFFSKLTLYQNLLVH